MEKDMKTLKGISLGDMYKKSEPEARMAGDYGRKAAWKVPAWMAGISAFIRKRFCVIRTDQLRNLGLMFLKTYGDILKGISVK